MFGNDVKDLMNPTLDEYKTGVESGLYVGGRSGVGYKSGGLISLKADPIAAGVAYQGSEEGVDRKPAGENNRAPAPTTAPSGGQSQAPTPPPPPPEPFRLDTKVGSSLGGLITGTLGSKGKSPFDFDVKGLKGLTTGKGKETTAQDEDKDRKRFTQGLFSTGVSVPSSGVGVQV